MKMAIEHQAGAGLTNIEGLARYRICSRYPQEIGQGHSPWHYISSDKKKNKIVLGIIHLVENAKTKHRHKHVI